MNFSSVTSVLQLDLKQYLKWLIGRQSKVLRERSEIIREGGLQIIGGGS